MKIKRIWLFFIFLPLFTGGCASRQSSFYILSPVIQATPQEFRHTILLAPVSIPSMADRSQLTTLLNGNQVKIDDLNLWAAPLKTETARVVAENLMATLSHAQVITPGILPREGEPYYRIHINLLRFEAALGEKATLDALWSIEHNTKGFIRSGKTTMEEILPDTDYETLISAYNRLLARLSEDITQELLREKTP